MRLRPLTDGTPKPLLPVLGQPILAHTLRQLAAAGCEAAAVNLHHRGDQIRQALGGAVAGMPLTWSEEPVLLGTLGALRPLDGFFAGADLALIVNGDSLCRWPLAELIRRHLERGAPATLLLTARADPAEFGGGVAVGDRGALLSLRPGAAGQEPPRGNRRRVFAGAHVLSRELVAKARIAAATAPVPADIVRDLYEPLLVEHPGRLASLTTRRPWHDLGTPRRYLAGALDWARAAAGGRWISAAAEVSPAAAVRRAIVEAGCRVAAGAIVEDSLLLPGAAVGAGCAVRGAVLGPGAELAAGNHVADQLVVAGGGRSVLR